MEPDDTARVEGNTITFGKNAARASSRKTCNMGGLVRMRRWAKLWSNAGWKCNLHCSIKRQTEKYEGIKIYFASVIYETLPWFMTKKLQMMICFQIKNYKTKRLDVIFKKLQFRMILFLGSIILYEWLETISQALPICRPAQDWLPLINSYFFSKWTFPRTFLLLNNIISMFWM